MEEFSDELELEKLPEEPLVALPQEIREELLDELQELFQEKLLDNFWTNPQLFAEESRRILRRN